MTFLYLLRLRCGANILIRNLTSLYWLIILYLIKNKTQHNTFCLLLSKTVLTLKNNSILYFSIVLNTIWWSLKQCRLFLLTIILITLINLSSSIYRFAYTRRKTRQYYLLLSCTPYDLPHTSIHAICFPMDTNGW